MDKQEKMFASKVNRLCLEKEVFSLVRIEGQSIENVKKKTGLSKSTIYRYLRIFESDKPQLAAQMKKKAKDITQEDYKALQEEIARLRKELKQANLRADFYEEMVSFGKEVYGIDLKKAGTK